MTKKILISHTDLDGVGCGVVFHYAFGTGEDVETHYINYDEMNEYIPKVINENPDADIFITDLSVKEGKNEELLDLVSWKQKVIWLDHHKDSLFARDEYGIYVDTNHCGTYLLCAYLVGRGMTKELAPVINFVHTVEDWDLWIHNNPLSKMHNTLLGFIGKEAYIDRMIHNSDIDLTQQEMVIVDAINKEKQKYFEEKRDKVFSKMHNKFEILNYVVATRHISELGHYLMEELELDHIAIINPEYGTVSVRSRGNDKANQIAKYKGGGGHPQASGFQIASDVTYNYVTNIFL